MTDRVGQLRYHPVVLMEVPAVVGKDEMLHVVLLFDEAQMLLDGAASFVYRCIRAWLKLDQKLYVVAVFTGTTSKLAHYYPESLTQTGYSRDAASNYLGKGEKLYDPFYEFCTIGILKSRFKNPI